MSDIFRNHATRTGQRVRSLSVSLSILTFLIAATACGDADDSTVDDESAHECVVHIEFSDAQSGELDYCSVRTYPTLTAKECEDDKLDDALYYADMSGKVVNSCSTDNVAATCKWTVASFAGTDVSYDYRYYEPLECHQAKFLCDDDEAEFSCTDI